MLHEILFLWAQKFEPFILFSTSNLLVRGSLLARYHAIICEETCCLCDVLLWCALFIDENEMSTGTNLPSKCWLVYRSEISCRYLMCDAVTWLYVALDRHWACWPIDLASVLNHMLCPVGGFYGENLVRLGWFYVSPQECHSLLVNHSLLEALVLLLPWRVGVSSVYFWMIVSENIPKVEYTEGHFIGFTRICVLIGFCFKLSLKFIVWQLVNSGCTTRDNPVWQAVPNRHYAHEERCFVLLGSHSWTKQCLVVEIFRLPRMGLKWIVLDERFPRENFSTNTQLLELLTDLEWLPTQVFRAIKARSHPVGAAPPRWAMILITWRSDDV